VQDVLCFFRFVFFIDVLFFVATTLFVDLFCGRLFFTNCYFFGIVLLGFNATGSILMLSLFVHDLALQLAVAAGDTSPLNHV
jgi:hypothetical protein